MKKEGGGLNVVLVDLRERRAFDLKVLKSFRAVRELLAKAFTCGVREVCPRCNSVSMIQIEEVGWLP